MVTNTPATRVVGTLKRKVVKDISIALGLGLVSASAWWHMYHVPKNDARDHWYANYAKSKDEE